MIRSQFRVHTVFITHFRDLLLCLLQCSLISLIILYFFLLLFRQAPDGDKILCAIAGVTQYHPNPSNFADVYWNEWIESRRVSDDARWALTDQSLRNLWQINKKKRCVPHFRERENVCGLRQAYITNETNSDNACVWFCDWVCNNNQ